MAPERRLHYLLPALLCLGFAAVFLSFALGLFPMPGERGLGSFGLRLATGGVGGIGLFFSIYLGTWALRGRNPAAGSDRSRVREDFSIHGGSSTRYVQARARTLLNLAAGSAASLMLIGFVIAGFGLGEFWMVAIPGLMGAFVIPFTVRGIYHSLTEPVVLEVGARGIRLRGHGLVRWEEIAALRIERYGRKPPPVEPGQEGPSNRRLGIVLRWDPGGFSFTSTLSGGAFSRVGVMEQELPVPLEEVVATARRYHPVTVEGTEAPASAAVREPLDGDARADRQAVIWEGRPVAPRILRRRVLRVLSAAGYQLLGIIGIAIPMALGGAAAAFPSVAMVIGGFLGVVVVLPGLLAARRAATSAAGRRYLLTQDFLVTEAGNQRHERRRANLPELRLDMDGDGVGTISYVLPSGPQIPPFLRRFVPDRDDDAILVESVPEAERLFQLLSERGVAPATDAPAAAAPPPTAGPMPEPGTLVASTPAGSVEPLMVTRLPGSPLRFALAIPWLFAVPFLLGGAFTFYMVVRDLSSSGAIWGLLFAAGFTAFPLVILREHYRAARRRRRLRDGGATAMAVVVGLADANVEVNGVDQWVVQYEYRVGGQPYRGESDAMASALATRWAAGDRVQVAYDPTRPADSLWLGGEPVDEE